MKNLILALMLAFGSLFVLSAAAPMATADVISDLNTGKDKTNQAAKIIIIISLCVAIAGCIGLGLLPATRRIGVALGVSLVVVTIIILIAKNSFIGETLSDINGSSDVTEILSK